MVRPGNTAILLSLIADRRSPLYPLDSSLALGNWSWVWPSAPEPLSSFLLVSLLAPRVFEAQLHSAFGCKVLLCPLNTAKGMAFLVTRMRWRREEGLISLPLAILVSSQRCVVGWAGGSEGEITLERERLKVLQDTSAMVTKYERLVKGQLL
ncbi:hypothetical protein GW17_00053700 [Ensete ventricosum]|nr:hypothetical protein GW17_00053700 [Ensete ventricosum]